MMMNEDGILKAEKSKASCSLVDITNLFLNYLKSQEGKEVDLTQVENSLGISKRRLYDVTNVLAGVGAIERTGKAKVKWIDNDSFDDDANDEMPSLEQLIEYEQELDLKTKEISDRLDGLTNSPTFMQNSYVSLNEIFQNDIPNPEISQFILSGPHDLSIEFDEDSYLSFVASSKSGPVNITPLNLRH
ncbi:hypothetical protein TRFO_29731 [Tritrichomonas foetus]|uniref:E2F/DP family winged-helix DNA-binding domain-containing protein n=1 Tax=Tritrichomonas foetus TaxID=1144522 RepID=A0A1J4JUZ0_9EUKA|nr:hypothetical protein TRFO_29731 [Tritrichomonas foetus]|eukprot:OHT02975.1 hypothetical protein TRFO_29731 [Tritrichomonas foetus]